MVRERNKKPIPHTDKELERRRFTSMSAKFARIKSTGRVTTSVGAAMNNIQEKKDEQELIDAGEFVKCSIGNCIAIRRCVDVCRRIRFAIERDEELEERRTRAAAKATGERREPA